MLDPDDLHGTVVVGLGWTLSESLLVDPDDLQELVRRPAACVSVSVCECESVCGSCASGTEAPERET